MRRNVTKWTLKGEDGAIRELKCNEEIQLSKNILIKSVDNSLHVTGEGTTASRDGKTITLDAGEPFVVTANDCTRHDLNIGRFKVEVTFHMTSSTPPRSSSSSSNKTKADKKKRPRMFGIFDRSSKKKKNCKTETFQANTSNPVVKLPSNWYAFGTLITREFQTTIPSRSLAAFDFDGCVVNTHFNVDMVLPRDLINEHVVPRLQMLHDNGYTIAILSNEASIGIRKTKGAIERAIGIKTSRMNEFAKLVNRPMWLLVATSKDKYRKPDTKKGDGGTKMWSHVVKHSKASNLEKSFYVGDSAGRQGDHSDCDKNFAKLCGVTFYTQTEFFGTTPPLTWLTTTTTTATTTDDSTTFFRMIRESKGTTILLVLVGLPGSGKSHFSAKLCAQDKKWTRVCQDILKSREKCKSAAYDALSRGQSVVIDRTNVTAEQRSVWIDIAKKHNVPCFCLSLRSDAKCEISHLTSRCVSRVSHEGNLNGKLKEKQIKSVLSRMAKNYVKPSLSEGFVSVFSCVRDEDADVALSNITAT